jgi:hypothetical protein
MWFILIFHMYMLFIPIFYIMSGRLFSTTAVIFLLSFLISCRRPMVGLLLIFIDPLSVAIHETFPKKVLLQFAGKRVETGP